MWTLRALLALLSVLVVCPAAQAADRSFANRFRATDTGDLSVIGNTSMTCPDSSPTCAAAQAGTAPPGQNQDNAYLMQYVDVDSDAATLSSSTADLSLPPGATVLFAGLYWGGDSTAPDSQRRAVKLDTPSPGGYVDLTGSTLDTATINANVYQAFVDVTALVQAGGGGTYAVANVQGTPEASNKWAGWSLVVAYRDAAAPRRTLAVYDGLRTVSTTRRSLSVPLSGLAAPLTGPVGASIGVVAYDSDRGLAGDSLRLNGRDLLDSLNPADNVFNSSITRRGTALSAKQPSYVNQLGFEADVLAADGILAPGSESATLELTTTKDNYHAGVLTVAADSRVEPGGSSIPGNRAAPSVCQRLLKGARSKRLRLRGVGRLQVRVRANGLVTSTEPALVTVEGFTAGLRRVRYLLNGRKLRASRQAPFTLLLPPRLLNGRTNNLLTVRLVPRRGRARRVTLRLGTTSCRTIFSAAQRRTRRGSRLTLRVDSLRSLGRIAFSVPGRMLPARVARTRVGRLSLRVAGGPRRSYRLSFGRRKRGGLLRAAGAPRVRLGRRRVTVTRLPAGTGIVKLVLLARHTTRPSALLLPWQSVRLRALVEGGGSRERLSLRLRGR